MSRIESDRDYPHLSQEEMMRMIQGWNGPRTAVIALGLFACASTGAYADSILTYSTAGSVDASSSTDGVTGANVISYIPIKTASPDANSNISLGYFQVAGEASGASTVYNNTPFSITYVPASIDGNAINGTATITGVLNGTVTGNNYSNVVASFNSLSGASFQAVDGGNTMTTTLSIPKGSLDLVPSMTGNGETTVEGTVATTGVPVVQETAAPEPSTIALFLSTVAGLGLRKYVLSRRQASSALTPSV